MIIVDTDRILQIGDVIMLSKVYIENAPYNIPDIIKVRVVDITTDENGVKSLTLQKVADDARPN